MLAGNSQDQPLVMASVRIEVVDAREYASVASTVLQAAWNPPCLHYSPQYLAWQFSFPRETKATGAIAFVADRPSGCIATTSRWLRYEKTQFLASILSFAAVDPVARGKGLGSRLYHAFLDALPRDVPVIAFTEPGTVGERLLISSTARADYRHCFLRECRAVGYLNRSTSLVPGDAIVRENATFDEFAAATEAAIDGTTVWTHFTPEQWQQYRRDPRGRAMLTIHDSSGTPLGTATIVFTEVITAQGLQNITMLESVALNKPTGDAVAAVFRFAAARTQPGSTVIASNLSYIEHQIIKAAGSRALPSSFNAHLFIKGNRHMVERASSTNLEVI